MIWKILCISNTISNIFLAVTLSLVIYRTINAKKAKKTTQPVYKKYGSK